ncbi:MAG: NAD(P)-binding domain-containing protein [Alphaproteobacteria bacterium]
MATERVDTLIIGAGQAGLAMSHMLSRRGCGHLVVERHRIAERWRSERWDGLRFQFPNWSVQLPDFAFAHRDADAFAASPDIVDFLCAYADFAKAPVRCGVDVTALRRDGAGFVAETSTGPIASSNVVIATGPYQRAITPPLAKDVSSVFQVHASRYTNPDQLPPGAVLVVGSGASGAQIAEELARAGRRVFISVGRHKRMPRRYRGRDLIWWLSELGLDQTPVEKRGPDRALPLITGAYGGHTIDFRDYAAQGMTLLGHVTAARDGAMDFAADVAATLAAGDTTYLAFLDLVDSHIERSGLDMPAEPDARVFRADPPCVTAPLTHLTFADAGISAIIWATGYGVDFGWIGLPVFDGRGEPVHRRGVTDIPGLYFLGLQWLSRMNSSFLSGVGEDAAFLAGHISMRQKANSLGVTAA